MVPLADMEAGATGAATSSSADPPWHALEAAAVAEQLGSPTDGLGSDEAAARLARFGPNRLTPPKRRPAWMRFLAQFHNLLIYVLLVSGVVALLLRHWTDAGVIFGVVLVNALIGYIQEDKAEQALEAIRNLLSPQAVVLRDGHAVTLAADELVPGDRVFLVSGDRVPADLRLDRTKGLLVQEAALTGESVPAAKSAAAVAADAALGDRGGMAYAGTMVVQGQGTGIVVATGDATEVGRIGHLLASVTTVATPLLVSMARFGRWLTGGILLLAGGTVLFGMLVHGEPWQDMVLTAVGLAVAAIPEGLPAVMTITMAVGVTRMARRNAIIRHLPAVEMLGSVRTICTDKTGTLTRNELLATSIVTAEATYVAGGSGYAPEGEIRREDRLVDPAAEPLLLDLARAALLCNDAALHRDPDGEWQLAGDPTDGALLALAMKAGLDPDGEAKHYPRRDALPFESERQYMATLHHDHAGHGILLVKGAPERVLALCERERRGDGAVPLDRPRWTALTAELAGQGQRVLALAMRRTPIDLSELIDGDLREEGLELLGLCGLIDPPREEALVAVAACRQAGITVKMITGDHAATAAAIGRRFGLPDGVTSGPQLDRLDEAGFAAAAAANSVFARTTPEHKLRLIAALQAAGDTVAMTGDGVNDAPALKRADIGVAMGRNGTEAAKEVAAMVLADDNFASIVHAVEEGRTVYDNLRKTILFMLPTNGAQAVVILLAVLSGSLLPITPVQILWVNMVTAVTLGLALAFEAPEPGVMARPPRPRDEPILAGRLVRRMLVVLALLVASSFGFFHFHRLQGDGIEEARTIAVNALVVGEIFFLLSARDLHGRGELLSALAGSRPVWLSIALMTLLQLAFTYAPPMQALFGTTPLGLAAWAAMAAAGAGLFVLMELEKRLSGAPTRLSPRSDSGSRNGRRPA
ncbi:magnesium-transporting ATPase (P-type) [Azospirillum lipoferum]|uniref:HAD-IC family P-type ATPase n=1 Tax=Azospirillum lipoferum TaxID=193 RepID=A0A5A9GR46_AZOLI|nr:MULTISPECIES: HAD-IC family P-type ATPase [Azospirillum]KAA0596265.1 HAD-IC family P-type ATPase [Azospirillum lipoferum]MCP1611233.1 magnesium-transporting ATPase (P-type) [Azospirillum lipoferum]MDW5533642.1 HAD-IC family P-type ATPase [Azospirillum sp. NL1]